MENCIKWDTEDLEFLKRQGLTEATATVAVNKFHARYGLDKFPSLQWIMDNAELSIPAALKEAGISNYPKKVSLQQSQNMGTAISKANNRLFFNGVSRTYFINFTQLGQADMFTWEFRQSPNKLNIAKKLQRLEQRDGDKKRINKPLEETKNVLYKAKPAKKQLDLFGNEVKFIPNTDAIKESEKFGTRFSVIGDVNDPNFNTITSREDPLWYVNTFLDDSNEDFTIFNEDMVDGFGERFKQEVFGGEDIFSHEEETLEKIISDTKSPKSATSKALISPNRGAKLATQMDRQLEYQKNRLKRLSRELSNINDGTKTVTPMQKAEISQNINKVRIEIKRLEERQVELIQTKSIDRVVDIMGIQLNEISALLNSNQNLSPEEIAYAFTIINAINAGIDMKQVEPYIFERNELNPRTSTPAMQSIVAKAIGLTQTTSQLYQDLTKIIEDYIEKEVQKEWVENGNIIDFDTIKKNGMKDISPITGLFISISQSSDPVAETLYKWNKDANYAAHMEAKNISDKVDKLTRDAEPLMRKHKGKYGLFDVFMQVDEKGRKTHNLVDLNTVKYWNARNENQNAFYGKMNRPKIKKAFQWIDNNELFFDPRILFPDTIEEFKPSGQSMNQHVRELKEALGERMYNKLYAKAKKKVENYNEELEGLIAYLDANESDEANRIREIEEFINQKSPYKMSEFKESGYSVGKLQKFQPSFSYVIRIAKKEDATGNSLGYYDSKYETIHKEGNEALAEFYDYSMTTLKDLKSMVPSYNRKLMQQNALPFLKATVLEQVSLAQVPEAAAATWDVLKEGFTDPDDDTEIKTSIDPVTGKARKKFNTGFLKDYKKESVRMFNLKMIEYRNAHDQKDPSKEEQTEMWRDIEASIANRQGNDINKIIKAFALSSLTLRHKEEIEGQMALSKKYLELFRKQSATTLSGKQKTNVGRNTKETGLKNYEAMIDYFYDTFYGYGSYDIEGPHRQNDKDRPAAKWTKKVWGIRQLVDAKRKLVVKNKVYTGLEKEIKDKIIKLKDENVEALKSGAISDLTYEARQQVLDNYLDTSGRVATLSRSGDLILRWVQLRTMGWNLTSGISNMMFGLVGNYIEAGGEEFFTHRELNWALAHVMASVSRNGLFNVKIGHAMKIRNLMLQTDALKEIKHETLKRKVTGRRRRVWNKFKFLSPYNIQSRTEYVNQATTMIAVMKFEKIADEDGVMHDLFDAYDNKGKLKPEFVKDGNPITEQNKKDYEGDWGNKDENKKMKLIKAKVDQAITRIHGDYDPDSALRIRKSLAGRFVSQFRRWSFQQFKERFGGESLSNITGKKKKGRYRSGYALFSWANDTDLNIMQQTLFNTFYLLKKATWGTNLKPATRINNWFDIEDSGVMGGLMHKISKAETVKHEDIGFSELDARNLRKNLNELLAFLITFAIGKLVKHFRDEDEDEEDDRPDLAWAFNLLSNQTNRLEMDVQFYSHPGQFKSMMKGNVIPAFIIWDDMEKISKAFKNYEEDMNGDKFYATVESGPFEGMDIRLYEIIRSSPFLSQVVRTRKQLDSVIKYK